MAAKRLFQPRLWLVICLVLAGAWLVFQLVIAPSHERERQIRTETAKVRQQIADGRNTLMEIRSLEIQTNIARNQLQRLDSEYPSSPAVVWIPERVQQHFGRSGFAELKTTVKNALNEPQLPGYERVSWSIEIPMQNVTRQMGGLLLAVADFEEKERIVRVADIAIEADAREPGSHAAVVHFSTLLRK